MLAMRLMPAHSHQLAIVWLFAENFIGAGVAAFILAVPLAWLIRGYPLLLASLLAAATTVAVLFMWQGNFADLAGALTFAELLAFFLFCWLLAGLVVRNIWGARHAA
jgi:hypothetical protein